MPGCGAPRPVSAIRIARTRRPGALGISERANTPVIFDSGVRGGDHIVRPSPSARRPSRPAAPAPTGSRSAAMTASADLLMAIDGYPTIADLSPDALQARVWTMRSRRRPGIRLTTSPGLPVRIPRNRRPPPRGRQPGLMMVSPDVVSGRGLPAAGDPGMVAHWLASFSNVAKREGRPPG